MKNYTLDELVTRLKEYFKQGNVKLDKFENFILDKNSLNINYKDEYVRDTIYEDNDFEIIIRNWASDEKKDENYHDHCKNGCLVKVIKGKGLEERLLNKKNIVKNTILDENREDLIYIDNEIGTHIISNTEEDVLITLHIYSPPGYISKDIPKR